MSSSFYTAGPWLDLKLTVLLAAFRIVKGCSVSRFPSVDSDGIIPYGFALISQYLD